MSADIFYGTAGIAELELLKGTSDLEFAVKKYYEAIGSPIENFSWEKLFLIDGIGKALQEYITIDGIEKKKLVEWIIDKAIKNLING